MIDRPCASLRRVLPILVATVTIGLLYGRAVRFGFDWDDYHFVHAYRALDVGRAFVGPFDTSGIEAAFYRPFTIALYAVRFAMVGDSGVWNHLIGLVLLLAACWLCDHWLAQEGVSTGARTIAVTTMVVHPLTPPSLAIWITTQSQTVVVGLMFAALIAAQRRAPSVVLLLGAIAALIKEDGVLVAPLAIGITCLFERRRPRWREISGSAALVAGLIVAHAIALRGLGGYHVSQDAGAVAGRYFGGVVTVFDVLRGLPDGRAELTSALAFALLAALAAAVAWRRPSRSARLPVVGWFALLLVLAPVALATLKFSQYSLGIASLSIIVAGISEAGLTSDVRAFRALSAAGAVVVLLLAAWRCERSIQDYAPCSAQTQAHDREVLTWTAVPPRLRSELIGKRCQ